MRILHDHTFQFHSQVQRHGTHMLPGQNASKPTTGYGQHPRLQVEAYKAPHPTLVCSRMWLRLASSPLLAARRYRSQSCLCPPPN